MLEITRVPGEAIVIGDDDPPIRIELMKIDHERNQARIGIQAPREIAVDREEIRERQQANQEFPPRFDEGEIDKIMTRVLDRYTITQVLGSVERVAGRNPARRKAFWAILRQKAERLIGPAS